MYCRNKVGFAQNIAGVDIRSDQNVGAADHFVEQALVMGRFKRDGVVEQWAINDAVFAELAAPPILARTAASRCSELPVNLFY